MALSRANFLIRFPEFGDGGVSGQERAPEELIDDALARAASRVSDAIWTDLADEGIGYLAAHLISISPWGQQARLVPAQPDGTTTYWAAYMALLRGEVGAPGMIVL